MQASGRPGASATRNAGLSRVTSDYVAFLDDDDDFLPDKLALLIKAMIETESVFGFSDYYRVSDTRSEYVDCALNPNYRGNFAAEIAFDSCRVATPSVVLKMEFIRDLLPLFPENLIRREDNYAWLRIAGTPGFKLVHVGSALVNVNLAENSIQRPANKNPTQRTPLVSREEKEVLRLAKRIGLKAPRFFILKMISLRLLIRVRDVWVKRSTPST
jgi:glycosyltransferase involved in cell wall biosynthesis